MAVFIPNLAGIKAIALQPLVQAALEALAERIKEGAISAAPEDEGDYISGIEVTSGELPGSKRVVATDWKSGLIEFGTENTPAFAPLRNGADAAGVALVGDGE